MNGRLRKASALLATVALVSGGVIAALAAPASASTQTGCESYCTTQFSGIGTPENDASYQLGQEFSVSDPGIAGYICYPNDDGAGGLEPTDLITLYDKTSGSTAVSGTAADYGPQLSCIFAGVPLTPGDTYIASYTVHKDYYQNTGGGFGTTGDVTGLGGLWGAPGNINPGNTGDSFGLRVDFESNPNAPDVSVAQNGPTSVTASFSGDGFGGATFSMTCTSSTLGVLGPFTTSPQTFTVPNKPTQTMSCSVTETVAPFLTLTSPAGTASTTFSGVSGPGCVGKVDAPTQLSAASMAFPGAVVSWAPVTADPAGCLVGYLVTPIGGSAGTPTFSLGTGTTTQVLGLNEGSTYTFTVAAVTGSGAGPASTPTGPVTIGTPAAATAVKATRVAKGAIKVAFKAGNDNGAAITGFAVTCGPRTILGHASPVTVKGLTPGKSVTCTVKAANSRGTGARSARSARVKP